MRMLVAWSVLALVLAGCSGNGGGKPDGAPLVGEDGLPLGPKMTTLKNELAAPIHRTIWENGSFAPHETCNTGGCITSDAAGFHRVEVEVPRDVPVVLGVDLSFGTGPQGDIFGAMDSWLEVDATYYRYSIERTPGQIRVDATLLPTTNVNVVVAAYSPNGEAPEMAYELRITVAAESELVTPGVPIGVAVGPGDEILLRSPTGVLTTFLLYGPDDAFLGAFETDRTLPADAAEGEYVVLIPPGAPAANVSTDSGATSMKTLGLAFANGETGVLPPSGPYEVEMEVTGYPLAVGWVAQSTPGSNGIGVMASLAFTVVLTGPNGVELDSGTICGLCISGGFGLAMKTESGDPRVVAGTYLLEAETQATSEVEVIPYAIYIQRFG